MKQVFEGYLCHSKTRKELYGYTFLLSKSPPVNKTIELHWGGTEEQTIPQTDEDVVFFEDKLFASCEEGKKYRVTIEEVE